MLTVGSSPSLLCGLHKVHSERPVLSRERDLPGVGVQDVAACLDPAVREAAKYHEDGLFGGGYAALDYIVSFFWVRSMTRPFWTSADARP